MHEMGGPSSCPDYSYAALGPHLTCGSKGCTWGTCSACIWACSVSLWGLGYVVRPGDMLASGICMCLVRESMRGCFSGGAPEVSGVAVDGLEWMAGGM